MTEPNNTFNDATVVPDIYLEQNFYTSDSVSPSDLDDYFKFYTLYGPSNLYVSLLGLSADADLYVYDQNQVLVASSTAGGNTSETINVALQGNQYYYVKVHNYTPSNTTNYGLYLYNDYSGPTLETARDIGTSWGQTSSKYLAYNKINWQDYLDYRDNVDVVKFTMEASGTISLRMKDFTYSGGLQATMQLLDSSGSVLQTVSGTVGDGLNVDRYSVPAGTYYVRYTQISGSDPYTLRIVSDYAGDMTATARDLGNLSGTSRRLYDMVGGSFGLPTYEDANDLYKFTLDKTSPIDIRLDIDTDSFPAPTFDANLRLAQDTNGNGFIDSGDLFLLSSSNPGDDQFSTTLGAGTYYVQVLQNGAYTSYQLDLDSDFDAVPGDTQDYKNMSKARSFGALTGETPFNFNDGFGISAGDFSDYFKFTMTVAGRLSASAFNNSYYSREIQNPSLSIVRDLNGNNRLDAGETITPFSIASLTADLTAGTYFLHANGTGEQAAYYLRLVSDYAGNTLSTARPLAAISGPTPPTQTFRDYIEQFFDATSDVNDFYRFDLPSDYQVTMNTTGVAGEDLSLSLIKDTNNNNVIDSGDILATSNVLNSPAETLSRALTAGRYFARVQGVNGSTNYTLTVKFGSGLVATGNAGNNLISGDFLNDTLSGLAGNDTLSGGAGADSMVGGTGNDTYSVDNTSDRIVELANEGIDTVNSAITYTLGANLENLTLTGTANVNGTGNTLNNRMTGNSSNNRLDGGDGNDTLIGGSGNDTLSGGNGNDSMVGGVGNDLYGVNTTGDRVIENANEGIDTVNSAITYTLATNLENLTLTGTTAINGTGNTLNNVITGNSGNNVLTGGARNDTLIGGAGNDTLIGGIGNDTLTGSTGNDFFRFNSTSEKVDRITDFNITDDTIQIVKSSFNSNLALGILSSSRFTIGASATTSAQRFFYNSSNGGLFFDSDGNGATSAVQFATLNTGLALTNQDIVVI
jgi:Ca2+-binding RTX toxin-like protein